MDIVTLVADYIVAWAKRNPIQAILLTLFIVSLFGATVQSGWLGILYRFGRARRVLEPGFRWLIPGVEKVGKIRSRALTLELPRQRVATEEGLVYDATASIVYRVRDAIAAVVEIDDLTAGVETVAALAVYEVLRPQTRESIARRETLDEQFTLIARGKLARWGLDVDRAGFTTIAPTARTLRVTQLAPLVRERASVAAALPLPLDDALTLLGGERRLVPHARARYRERARRPHVPTIPDRLTQRVSMAERAEIEEEIDLLLSDDWADELQGREGVEKRGRVALPFLRARLKRTGDEARRARLRRASDEIERRP